MNIAAGQTCFCKLVYGQLPEINCIALSAEISFKTRAEIRFKIHELGPGRTKAGTTYREQVAGITAVALTDIGNSFARKINCVPTPAVMQPGHKITIFMSDLNRLTIGSLDHKSVSCGGSRQTVTFQNSLIGRGTIRKIIMYYITMNLNAFMPMGDSQSCG